jgi:hypothetical protein
MSVYPRCLPAIAITAAQGVRTFHPYPLTRG